MAMTAIEWTRQSWNPLRARVVGPDGTVLAVGWHCEHVSRGCQHCYAEGLNKRRLPNAGTGLAYKPGLLGLLPDAECDRLGYPRGARLEIFLDEEVLRQPLSWRKPQTVFLCSTTDLFGAFVPNWMIDRIYAVMALCPDLIFQVLTKRERRARAYLSRCGRRGGWHCSEDVDARIARAAEELTGSSAANCTFLGTSDGWPLRNVWLGVSVEDQATAQDRVPELLAAPAAKRFLSAEPLLGPLDLRCLDIAGWWELDALRSQTPADVWATEWDPEVTGTTLEEAVKGFEDEGFRFPPSDVPSPRVDWVIAGGESGAGARPLHPDWVRAVRDQCAAAGVPFFFKQWGACLPWSQFNEAGVDDDPEVTRYATMEWDGSAWQDVGRPGWWESADGAIDGRQCVARVGKGKAGRVLDGRTHDDLPPLAHEEAAHV